MFCFKFGQLAIRVIEMHYLKYQRPDLVADFKLQSRTLLPQIHHVIWTLASQPDHFVTGNLGVCDPKLRHFLLFVT
jgi:hypothetical protein